MAINAFFQHSWKEIVLYNDMFKAILCFESFYYVYHSIYCIVSDPDAHDLKIFVFHNLTYYNILRIVIYLGL